MPIHPSPFVLANTKHGTLILSYLDYADLAHVKMIGVGVRLLRTGALDEQEIQMGRTLLDWRRQRYGDGCIAIDCGANIGVMTIEWAKHMHRWGSVLAFEMQRHVFYALAGNVVIHNCFNVDARQHAVGNVDGEIDIARLDFTESASIGSVGLRITSDVGQTPVAKEQVAHGADRWPGSCAT